MKLLRSFVITFFLLFVFSACTYNSSIKESAFRDSCSPNKIPIRIGIVETQNLKSWRASYKTGNYDIKVRLDEALRKSVYDLMSCHFKEVRFVKDIRDSESIDVFTYCKYVTDGQNKLLEISLKDNKENRDIKSYTHSAPIVYSHPSSTRALGIITGVTLGLTAPITVPVMTQLMGSAYEDALLLNLRTEFGNVNDQIKSDKTLINYAALKDKSSFFNENSPVKEDKEQKEQTVTVPNSIYDELMGCVVVIKSNKGIGSGFFVSRNGLIVTNAHVIEGNSRVSVIMRDKKVLFGSVMAIDKNRDLALISVTGTDYPSLAIGDIEKEGSIGNEVIAIGVPQGLGWSLSKGVISAIRNSEGIILVQTDTAINKGNSGGPLINMNTGRVIGINAFIFKKEIATGLNFAVCSCELKKAFPKYIK